MARAELSWPKAELTEAAVRLLSRPPSSNEAGWGAVAPQPASTAFAQAAPWQRLYFLPDPHGHGAFFGVPG